jgi:hypothetical protein
MNHWYELVFVAFVRVTVVIFAIIEAARKDYQIDEEKGSVKKERFECSESFN